MHIAPIMTWINKSIDHGKGSSNATLLENKIGLKKRNIDEINDDRNIRRLLQIEAIILLTRGEEKETIINTL